MGSGGVLTPPVSTLNNALYWKRSTATKKPKQKVAFQPLTNIMHPIKQLIIFTHLLFFFSPFNSWIQKIFIKLVNEWDVNELDSYLA